MDGRNAAFHQFVLFLAIMLFAVTPAALAQEAQPGDSCAGYSAGVFQRTAGPEVAGGGHFMICDGANWISFLDYADFGSTLTQVGHDSGTCTALKQGRMRYSSSSDTWTYCNGSAWSAFISTAAGADREIQFNSGGDLAASSTFKLTADGDLLLTGTHTGTPSAPGSGPGARLFYDTQAGAFRAGYVTGAHWDTTNIGDRSIGLGHDAKATNSYSVAIGEDITSSGWGSVALGRETEVSGNYSMALGLGDNDPGIFPTVSGQFSLGIFMGFQNAVDVSANNVMAILGGKVGIESAAPQATLDVAGEIKFSSAGLSCAAATAGAMRYAAATMEYCNGTAWKTLGPTTLANLTDTDLDAVADGQFIRYDNASGLWKPVNIDLSDLPGIIIDYLDDVTINAPADAQVLTYNGGLGKWENQTPPGYLPGGGDRQIQFNSGGALSADPNFVFTSAGNVGVGTTTPDAKLDVAGEIKIDDTGLTCSASTEGAVRYNNTQKTIEFCNGVGWIDVEPAAGSGPTYQGVTTTSYNGNWSTPSGKNNRKAGDALCQIDYPGSRVMACSDLSHQSVRDSITDTQANWIYFDGPIAGASSSNGYAYGSCGGIRIVLSSGNGMPNWNCWKWSSTSTSNTGRGVTYHGANDSASVSACNINRKIHCVAD